MNTQKFAPTHQKFVSQAKNKDSARAKTKKAWHLVSKKGQSQTKRVGVLVSICVLLLCIISAEIYACANLHTQRDGFISGPKTTRKCHQGQSTRQTTAKVSALGTCNTIHQITSINAKYTTQNQCKRVFVQAEVFGCAAIYCGPKSQKPSKVGGKKPNGGNIRIVKNEDMGGLITPPRNHENINDERRQKIRRLVHQIRQRRRKEFGLKKWQSERSLLQQNKEEQQNNAKPSIERLFQLDSSSESSTSDYGSNLASGVHTGSEKNAEGANGRNAFYSGRKQENSSFSTASNETGNPKYTDNWDDEKSGQKKHASAGRKNSGNASERDANERTRENSGDARKRNAGKRTGVNSGDARKRNAGKRAGTNNGDARERSASKRTGANSGDARERNAGKRTGTNSGDARGRNASKRTGVNGGDARERNASKRTGENHGDARKRDAGKRTRIGGGNARKRSAGKRTQRKGEKARERNVSKRTKGNGGDARKQFANKQSGTSDNLGYPMYTEDQVDESGKRHGRQKVRRGHKLREVM